MNYIKKFLGIYIAFVIQTVLFEKIDIFSTPPDILLAVLVLCATGLPPMKAMYMGVFAGLITDVMCGRIFGVNILIYMYLALFVSLTTAERTNNSPLLMSWVEFVSIAALEIMVGVIKAMLGYFPGIGFIVSSIFVKGLFGAFFALLFVLLCQKSQKRKADKNASRKGDEI